MQEDDRFDFSQEDGAFRDRLLTRLVPVFRNGIRVAIDDDELACLNAAGGDPSVWADAARRARIESDEQAT